MAHEQAQFASDRRRARRIIAGLTCAVLLIGLAAAFAFWQRRLAVNRQREAEVARQNEGKARAASEKQLVVAENRLTDLLQEQGRQDVLEGRGERALLYLAMALGRRPSDESLRFLLSRARSMLPKLLVGSPESEGVGALAFRPR